MSRALLPPEEAPIRLRALQAHLAMRARARAQHAVPPGDVLRALVDADLANLPPPGQGCTLHRWRMLAAVGSHDLSLAKLFEAHTDALAILAELGAPEPPASSTWGVWCDDAPDARLHSSIPSPDGTVTLRGVKAWCSGAASLSHALVSARNDDDAPVLAAVVLDQPGVAVSSQGWQAVGMAATASVDVRFNAARGVLIGAAGSYVGRPGFWHGGAGIAACWYGAAQALGEALCAACRDKAQRSDPALTADPADLGGQAARSLHQLAHLGAVDTALSAAATVLRDTAAWIDAHPTEDARLMALRTRLVVEDAATRVLQAVPRALGAAPLCRDSHIARLVADLPVFMRQSHAERDQATLGTDLLNLEETPMAAVMERIAESPVRVRPVADVPDVSEAPRIAGRGTPESAWRNCRHLAALPLATLDALVPHGSRAVIVAPHPDDEVLGAGGLMSQLAQTGRELMIMPVTDGTASHPGSRRWPPERLAQERPLETVKALTLLGLSRIHLHRLGLPDGGVDGLEGALAWQLAPHLRPSDVVITTWRQEGHPDHDATGRACATACAQTGARLIEMPVWAWHWARPGDSRLPWSRACRLPLSPDVEQRKRLAVRAFASQTRPDPSSEVGCVLPASALARVLRPYEVFFR